MSDTVITLFLDPAGSTNVESVARAAAAAGLRPAEAPESCAAEAASRLALGVRHDGSDARFPELAIPVSGIQAWMELRRVPPAGQVVHVATTPNPVREPRNAATFEAALGGLFRGLSLSYGYTSWQSTSPPWSGKLFQNDPRKGLAFELEALRRGRILHLRALNFFSEAFLATFPKLVEKLGEIRVVPLGTAARLVALAESLVWGPIRPEDMFALDVGLDLCWQWTGSLDAHVAACRRA